MQLGGICIEMMWFFSNKVPMESSFGLRNYQTALKQGVFLQAEVLYACEQKKG